MIRLPTDEPELVSFVADLMEQCRVSVGMRAAYCRLLNSIAETGRYDGTKALINTLNVHLQRLQAHIFSPVELKFSVDFDRSYPKPMVDKAQIVAKTITRSWARDNTDKLFALGVFGALKYGANILKQWVEMEGPPGPDQRPTNHRKLVQPWQFGVYNEAENDLDRQEAFVETTTLSLPEVWQRIWHRPDADKLFYKIKSHAMRGQAMSDPQSYFHQVLSTSQIQTGVQGATRPLPGGIVQLNNDPNYAIMGPQVAVDVVQCHELWVKGEDDYVTIETLDPDIIISPFIRNKKVTREVNLLGVKGRHPYTLIQPNEVSNWFWGRSELVDLIEPQMLLSVWCDDAKRLFGLQVDKILAFVGDNSITDERYGQFRVAGFTNLGPGSDVKDLTPKFPPEMLPMIKWVMETINWLSGFSDLMQGKGEQGVRAGVHADVLLKTGSATQRDQALTCERNAASAADLTLSIKEAKDNQNYWVDGTSVKSIEETSFKLGDLPEDWFVSVDSHSSSPIFSDENVQLILAAFKAGIVTADYVLDHLPLPDKEEAKLQRKAEAEQKQKFMQQLIQEYPELGEKLAQKQLTSGGKR
jgi:hypothetical protein